MTIKKLELIAVAITFVSFILTMLVPATNMLLVVGLGTLTYLNFLGGFALVDDLNKPNENPTAQTPSANPRAVKVHFFFGIAFTVSCAALLFKLMNWPNADMLIYIALAGLTVAAFIVAANYSKTSYYSPAIVKRLVIYIVLCATLVSLPQYTLLNFKYRNHPAYLEALKKSIKNPSDTAARNKLNLERQKLGK